MHQPPLLAVGNYTDLAASVQKARDQIYVSQSAGRLSSTQIDRLAAEASDLVYNLFNQTRQTSTSAPHYTKNETIMPVAFQESQSSLLSAPAGYRVAAIWNDNNRYGIKDGIFASLYEPKRAGDPVVFAFKGTQSGLDWKENLVNQGGAQLRSTFLMVSPQGAHENRAYSDLLQRLENGQDVLITGHSLGGGLAQAAAYLLQKDLESIRRRDVARGKTTRFGKLHLVTFNALGGRQTLDQFHQLLVKENQQQVYQNRSNDLKSLPIDTQIDETVVRAMDARNYAYKDDPVSSLYKHIGPTQIVQPKMQKPSREDMLLSAYGLNEQWNPVKDHSIKTIRQLIDPDFRI